LRIVIEVRIIALRNVVGVRVGSLRIVIERSVVVTVRISIAVSIEE
jgi:hypothetical protein